MQTLVAIPGVQRIACVLGGEFHLKILLEHVLESNQ